MKPIKLSILTPVWNQEELVLRALDSIPRRDDIEALVADDGSTDKTRENVIKYIDDHPELNAKLYYSKVNRGVSFGENKLLSKAKGEYFHFLMSDDYLYTDKYNQLIDHLYETDADVICMNLIENSGREYKLDETNGTFYCAQACRFIRRAFVYGITWPEDQKAGEDWFFHMDMMKRNPKVEYSGVAAYHYNYPREGSLVNLRLKGLI